MKESNLPPKIYRKLLENNYKQSHNEYQKIKNYQNSHSNPIVQKEDRYIPPKTRGNVLTQNYVKKMADKPERPHIKRIPIQSNLSSGVTVITEPKEVRGIRIGPVQKNQAHSVERRRVRKKIFPENNKIFYYDAFNSVKQNENDLANLRKNVSLLYFYILFILFYYRKDMDADLYIKVVLNLGMMSQK